MMTIESSKKRPVLAARLLLILAALATVTAASSADAEICKGVRRLPGSNDPALLAILSAQAGHRVGLSGVYRQGTWSIYEITLNGDLGNVFFNGPPRRSPKAFLWGGSAQPDEYVDVLADVRQHVPHIPDGLARCFARRVTGIAR